MTRPIRAEHLQPCVDWWGGPDRQGRTRNEVAWRVTLEEVQERGYNLDIRNPHHVADEHADPDELLVELDEADSRVSKVRAKLQILLEEALVR